MEKQADRHTLDDEIILLAKVMQIPVYKVENNAKRWYIETMKADKQFQDDLYAYHLKERA